MKVIWFKVENSMQLYDIQYLVIFSSGQSMTAHKIKDDPAHVTGLGLILTVL